jgi:hypothetical protein
MGAIVAVIGGLFARFLAVDALKFIAYRLMIVTALTLVLPVVLYNVFTELLQHLITYSNNAVSAGSFSGAVFDFVGLGAWVAIHIKLSQCFSVFLSALSLRWVLGFFRR